MPSQECMRSRGRKTLCDSASRLSQGSLEHFAATSVSVCPLPFSQHILAGMNTQISCPSRQPAVPGTAEERGWWGRFERSILPKGKFQSAKIYQSSILHAGRYIHQILFVLLKRKKGNKCLKSILLCAINTSVLIFSIFYFGPFCVKSLIKVFLWNCHHQTRRKKVKNGRTQLCIYEMLFSTKWIGTK